jgi:glutathione S-transferase
MSSLQPIKVYGKGGPNPPKIAILVRELSLPHEIIPKSFPSLKEPEYLAIVRILQSELPVRGILTS